MFYNLQCKIQSRTCMGALDWKFEKGQLIAVVGAGGKTTMIHMLAKELSALGYRVVITTTTHMMQPERNCYEWENMPKLQPGDVIYLGSECGNGKITKPTGLSFFDLKKRADIILVEADGSKNMPLKVPAEHEPVIPTETDLVIGVLGYNSVGKCVKSVSHRVADVETFLQKKGEDLVTVEDLMEISFHKKGLLKHVECPYRIIWNRWNHEKIAWNRDETLILCEER